MRDLRDIELDAFLARAEMLAQLRSLPAWAEWEGLLRDMRRAVLEELVSAVDPGEIRFLQGSAATLGEILDRPVRIVGTAAEYQRNQEADSRVMRPEFRAAIGLGVDREGGL